jgi:phospholipase A1/A2
MSSRPLAARCSLLALLFSQIAAGASAGDDEPLQRCAAIEDALARLVCYDTLAGRIRADQHANQPEAAEPARGQPEHARLPDGVLPQPLAEAIQEGALGPRLTFLSRHWELDPAAKQGTFLLRPHKQNYLLPVRYSSSPNDQPVSPTHGPPPAVGLDNIEAKFQLSLKTKVAERLFQGHADLWLAYTQQSSWQVYNPSISRPLRETDYEPEAMLVFPVDYDVLGLRGRLVNIGLVHQSNGRVNPLSRSWNRVYGQLGFERGKLALLARAWYRIPESASNDDNPDIEHYLGYGDLLAVYKWNARNTVSLLVRNNLQTGNNRSGFQLDWSFPLYGRLKGYVQLFSGYGESLIDYNWRQTTFGVGVLLTDWM